ncbi:MAG: hypothetical protein HY259_14570 [Chloroflexi bacterium]|nr:hypothetical protein [Chloroflexota bacterium]
MRKRLALLVAASGAFLLLTLAFQQAFTGYGFGGADLVPLWLGGRALLFERLSPYSAQVTLRSRPAARISLPLLILWSRCCRFCRSCFCRSASRRRRGWRPGFS